MAPFSENVDIVDAIGEDGVWLSRVSFSALTLHTTSPVLIKSNTMQWFASAVIYVWSL